jgi:hypothetical protein
MLALGQKALEPCFRLRRRVRTRHPDHIEALLACGIDKRALDSGQAF